MIDKEQLRIATESIDEFMYEGYCKEHPEVMAAVITSVSQTMTAQVTQDSLNMIHAAVLSVQHAIKHKEMS